MKKLRQIIAQLKTETHPDNDLIWQLICYSPKMALRLQQQQLLDEAEKFSLKVRDEYFAKNELLFNGFKWGNGQRKLLITHGWGSKAADFSEIIVELRKINDLEIIAFDAPGNGSSEGELSNLLLFIAAIKAIIGKYGEPDIMIGHSLGAMANVMAMKEVGFTPSLLISLAPLVRLKENFEYSMTLAGIQPAEQGAFLKSFEDIFGRPASQYNLPDWYPTDSAVNHWLAYDKNDPVSPRQYLEEFLNAYPPVIAKDYEDTGHERVIKSLAILNDIITVIDKNLRS